MRAPPGRRQPPPLPQASPCWPGRDAPSSCSATPLRGRPSPTDPSGPPTHSHTPPTHPRDHHYHHHYHYPHPHPRPHPHPTPTSLLRRLGLTPWAAPRCTRPTRRGHTAPGRPTQSAATPRPSGGCGGWVYGGWVRSGGGDAPSTAIPFDCHPPSPVSPPACPSPSAPTTTRLRSCRPLPSLPPASTSRPEAVLLPPSF